MKPGILVGEAVVVLTPACAVKRQLSDGDGPSATALSVADLQPLRMLIDTIESTIVA